ncbi:MAG TPA: hypothetical protein VMU37_05785, partial [Caulobacteraceae bacterium]|nr:hypothetical protein [Caulobacteraceae bacterium]
FALDQWLKEHIGRPYTIILGSSLATGIVVTAQNLTHLLSGPNKPSLANLGVILGTGLVQVALLINQLAQFHEFRQYVRDQRAARKAGRAARKVRDHGSAT